MTITYSGWNSLLLSMNLPPTTGTLVDGEPTLVKRIVRQVRRPQMRKLKALSRGLANSLNAAGSVGDTVSSTYSRVAYSADPGGQRTIETVTVRASGATTTADQTEVNLTMFDDITGFSTYPTDPSGNSGGGKAGF